MPNLFAYGTLMEAQVFTAVTGFHPPMVQAKLFGYERFAFIGECYPGIVAGNPNHFVVGQLIKDLPMRYLQRLDEYEGDLYSRQRVMVEIERDDEANLENLEAETYIVRPQFEHKLAHHDWDFEYFRRHHLEQYLSRS